MPNWCENWMEVTGERPVLERVKAAVDTDFLHAGLGGLRDGDVRDHGRCLVYRYETANAPRHGPVERVAKEFGEVVVTHVYREVRNGVRGFALYTGWRLAACRIDGPDQGGLLPAYFPRITGLAEQTYAPLRVTRAGAGGGGGGLVDWYGILGHDEWPGLLVRLPPEAYSALLTGGPPGDAEVGREAPAPGASPDGPSGDA